MLSGVLTEFAAEVEGLRAGTPLLAVDGSVWSYVHAKLLVAACERVQSAILVVLNVSQQLFKTTVSIRHKTHIQKQS